MLTHHFPKKALGSCIDIVYCCQCSCYYCSFMYSQINKLKKWLFYIYLLTTITKALYQPSEKGMSLLFTCPQLTEESSVPAAARMCLHMLCNFYQIESIPQFLELWSIFNALWWNTNFTLPYRDATTYSIILPCLKLSYFNFNLPNQLSH